MYNTSNYKYGAVLEIDDDLTPGIYEVIVTAKVSSGGVSSDSVSQTIKVIKKKLTGVVASLRSDKTAITLNLSEEGQINFFTTVSLDYNSGQRETANSSNCNVTWTMNPTVSGITLQTSGTNAYLKMPSNLAYGTYTITVTATASSGGITADPVSQTVTINKKGVTGIEASLTASKTATTLDSNQTDSIKFTEGVTFTYNIGDPKQALRNDDNDYYSVAWTLSPDVSGITLSDNTSEYDENGVTLNIGSNLAPGTYHVTVTAIVSRGSVKSAPVSQTVTITKNPPKLTSINASLSSSSESLTLDRASSGSLTFTPTITAYYDDYSSSNIASGYAIEWSMTPAVSGITLENGTLTIAPTTQAGSYTQKVTADVSYSDFSYKAESTVYITVNDNQLTLEQYLTYTGNDSEGVTSLSIPDYVENLDILASLTSLESLDLKNANKLTSVNLSGNTSIREVDLDNNSSITTLDLSGSSVRFVTARESNLTEINLENCTSLEELDCSSSEGSGNLRTLNLKGCSALKLLICSGNKLLTLDVNADEHPALEDIECFGQSLAIEELNNDIDTSKPELNLYDLISGNDSDFDPDNVMASIDIETIDDFTPSFKNASVSSTTISDDGMISFPANIKAITYYYDTGANIDGSNMDVTISFENMTFSDYQHEANPSAGESEEESESHDGGSSNNTDIDNDVSVDVDNDVDNDVSIINSNDIHINIDNDNKTGASTPLGKVADAASGGGCNVGVGIFALMFAVVCFSRKYRKFL